MLKKFMVVFQADGETGAYFYDTYLEAKNQHNNIGCMGYEAEIYARQEIEGQGEEYVLIEA